MPANLASYNQPDQLMSAIIKSKNIDVLLQREISNCMRILSPAAIDQLQVIDQAAACNTADTCRKSRFKRITNGRKSNTLSFCCFDNLALQHWHVRHVFVIIKSVLGAGPGPAPHPTAAHTAVNRQMDSESALDSIACSRN